MIPDEADGYSESVVVDGNPVICTPGSKDAALACLVRTTFKTFSTAGFPANVGKQRVDAAGFSTAVISNACCIRHFGHEVDTIALIEATPNRKSQFSVG